MSSMSRRPLVTPANLAHDATGESGIDLSALEQVIIDAGVVKCGAWQESRSMKVGRPSSKEGLLQAAPSISLRTRNSRPRASPEI